MAAAPMTMPTLTAPSQKSLAPPQLYAGGTNSTGMQMPVSPSAAPNGLTVSPTPGATGTTANATGTSGSNAAALLRENQNYLGQGVGATATNYLTSGAGYNGPLAQQTINATDAAMQTQINQQYGDLQTSLGNAGLSPNSSAAALSNSNFLSNASAQENEVAANQYTQMYSQSQTDYLSELEALQGINNAGTMNQQTTMGAIGSLLTGGLGGLAQYTGGAAGTAGAVTSTAGIFGGSGSSSGSGSAQNDALSFLGF
jgi:hypothetical protein